MLDRFDSEDDNEEATTTTTNKRKRPEENRHQHSLLVLEQCYDADDETARQAHSPIH